MTRYPLRPEFRKFACLKAPMNAFALRFARVLMRPLWALTPVPKNVLLQKFAIPGSRGQQMHITVLSPRGAKPASPCLLYLHGGAFAFMGAPNHKQLCCAYALKAGCRVVIPDYTLSFRAPFPAAIDDCIAAYTWILSNADALGIDASRIATGGDSAGGALSGALCIAARERGLSVPCFQMLVYPVTTQRLRTASMQRFTNTPMWNAVLNGKMWRLYLKHGDGDQPGLAAPLDADDLTGMPPTYIETAEFDCLHDEAVLYAKRLSAAGADVTLVETEGTVHGFDLIVGEPYVQRCAERRAAALAAAFAKEPRT